MPLSRRASEVASDGLSTALKLSNSIVNNIPIAGSVVGGLMWITETARQFKTNKEAWQDFAQYTATLRDDIQSLTGEPSMSPELSTDISSLQAPLLRIVSEMQRMTKRSIVSKILQAQEDPKKIVIFRQMLVDATTKFNTVQLVAIRLKLESMMLDHGGSSTEPLLPRTRIPKMKSCPEPFHLFTGRQNILDHIIKYFSIDLAHQGQRVYVLSGLGGSGKSQLAFKFVQLSQAKPKRFSQIFMIDATTSESIEADFKTLAQAKGLGDSFEMALRMLEAEVNDWLILFDNADDVNLNLRDYFPQCSHGNIIITTRNQAVRLHGSGSGSHYNVAEMDHSEAESLLLRILETSITVNDMTRGLVTTLAVELGWFALALCQVGSYIVISECGIEKYLDLFRERKRALPEENFINAQKLDGYQHSAYTTWQLSFEKLSPGATQLLQLLSFFHHDGIKERMLKIACHNAGTAGWVSKDTLSIFGSIFETDQIKWDGLRFLNVISEIRSYSLIDFDPTNDVYSIHPLVQTWIRIHVKPTSATRQAALSVLALCIDMPTDDFGHSKWFDRPFQDSLAVHADAALAQQPAECAEIAERLSSMYSEVLEYDKAFTLCNESQEFYEHNLGKENYLTLTNRCRMAELYHEMGKHTEAESLAERTFLSAWEIMPSHRFAFKSGISLSNLYRYTGKLQEAEELMLKELEKCCEAHGRSDYNTIDFMFHLGQVLLDGARFSEAEARFLEIIHIRKGLPDVEVEDNLDVMLSLSYTHIEQGRCDEAERILLELLNTANHQYGVHNKWSFDCKRYLALSYSKQQRFKEAEKLTMEALDNSKRIFGPKHNETLSIMSNLARDYVLQCRLEEAETLLKEVLDIEIQGKGRSSRLRRLSHLARVYHLQKRSDEAIDLMTDTLERLTLQLGSDHKWTIAAREDLARWKNEMDECNCVYYR